MTGSWVFALSCMTCLLFVVSVQSSQRTQIVVFGPHDTTCMLEPVQVLEVYDVCFTDVSCFPAAIKNWTYTSSCSSGSDFPKLGPGSWIVEEKWVTTNRSRGGGADENVKTSGANSTGPCPKSSFALATRTVTRTGMCVPVTPLVSGRGSAVFSCPLGIERHYASDNCTGKYTIFNKTLNVCYNSSPNYW
jgi:hypothetical protein